MMTLDPAGLEAAAKLARSCTPTAREDARLAEQIVRAYLAAAPDTGRSVLMHVPVTPTTENQPENVYARLRNRPPEPSAAVAWDEGYVAGFAAGRAAATPDPPDAYTACVEALAEWWTGEATAAEVTGWMNGALQAARLPELDREAAISMCNMVMADLRGECDYGAVVSNVLRAAYPAATPDPPSDRNIARMFHEAYERLAPEFGYRTREESAVPWEKVPAKNRDLMTATVGEVRAHLAAASPDERLREAAQEEVNDLRDQVQMYEEKAERDWRDFGEMQDARIAADDRVRELEAQIAACPEDSVSYRVRDRDSDYKAMCHADRDHAELLLKAWLSDGRDAVIESRIVYDAGWNLLASSTAEKLAAPRKRSASASDPMPLCDCELCARPLRDHDEEETR